MMPALTSQETKQLLAFQTNEITEHHIYHQKMKITAGY